MENFASPETVLGDVCAAVTTLPQVAVGQLLGPVGRLSIQPLKYVRIVICWCVSMEYVAIKPSRILLLSHTYITNATAARTQSLSMHASRCPCHVMALTPELQIQHRNACHAQATCPAHTGGKRQEFPSAPRPTAGVFSQGSTGRIIAFLSVRGPPWPTSLILPLGNRNEHKDALEQASTAWLISTTFVTYKGPCCTTSCSCIHVSVPHGRNV